MEKWKSWNELSGQGKEVSMQNYIRKVKLLYKKNK